MNENISVSVIVNNYNYACFLNEAIDSALNQTYPHVEVIVVDDASTDNSREAIASYGDRIVKVLRPVNGKQAAALNDGFAISQGEIIIFLDADDYLFPQAIERILEVWRAETAKVHYRLQVVDAANQPLGYFYPPSTVPLAEGEVWPQLIETGGYNSVPMSGNAYSRNILTKVFPIPEEYKLTADDYLNISIPFYGKVEKIEQPIGAYRIHNSNQWALTEVSDSRFRRFVRHDMQSYALLVKKTNEFNVKIPQDLERRSVGRLWSRLASLRLNSEKHPVPGDNSLILMSWGIQALWKYSDHNLPKRLIYSIWFICVGMMPLQIAKLAITWLYAPHLRPQAIDLVLKKIRILVS